MEQVDTTNKKKYNSKEDSNVYSRNQNNVPEIKSIFVWSCRLYNIVTEKLHKERLSELKLRMKNGRKRKCEK